MTDRLHEIVQDASRWAGEAWAEWSESIKESPEAHCYTLALGGLVAVAFMWVV